MTGSGHLGEVTIEADGGSRGNPGPSGFGAVVRDSSGAVLAERQGFLGTTTNNVAEYQGLIAGLQAAAELGAVSVEVRMDSKLVVEQMSGRWQVKHPSMRPLAKQAAQLAAQFDRVNYQWIPRAQNSHADRLANQAMDGVSGASATAEPTKQDDLFSATEPTMARSTAPTAEPIGQPIVTKGWVPPTSHATRLILVRHGVTEMSLRRQFAGISDAELVTKGVEQAQRAAQRVRELHAQTPITAVLSSSLNRARQTGQLIADAVELPLADAPGFEEVNFGEWDGYTFEEISQKWPTELSQWLGDHEVAPPGGESFSSATRRVRRARDRVLAQHAGHTVVVVSHVSPIKILVRLCLEAPSTALYRMFVAPAALTVIDYYVDGQVSLQSFNDTAHLIDL